MVECERGCAGVSAWVRLRAGEGTLRRWHGVVMGGRKCGLGQARGYSGGGRGWLGASGMFVVGFLNLSELIRTNRKVSDHF